MVKDFQKDSGNLSDSSIYKARIREQDIAANQKLQEIQGAADEFARQTIINELKQAELEREKLKLKLEQEVSGRVDNILSYVELNAAENEDNFTSSIDALLAKLFRFFNFVDSELGVETDPQIYRMVEEREKKEGWLAAIIKFLRDKFNKLIKAIFSRDLSFREQIDKEIGKLFERLFGGGLSKEEEVAILDRIEALQNLKLRLQMFAVGWVITMFAELFSVELTASVETTKEEGKEKASAKEKEATKEVHEIIEIKVDAKEKPTAPVSLFDFSSGGAKPITLTKPERDLLPEPLKNLMNPVPKPAINDENREVKETKAVKEEKKEAKPEAPKVALCPSKVPEQTPGMDGVKFDSEGKNIRSAGYDRRTSRSVSGRGTTFIDNNTNGFNKKGSKFTDGHETRDTTSNNKCSATSNFNGKGSKSTGGYEANNLDTKLREKVAQRNAQRECAEASSGHETDDLDAKLAAKAAERNARKKCAEAFTKHDYPVNTWVPSEITDVGVNNVKDQSVGRNDERTGMSRG
ncbi:MAG: hypothetical protein LBH78_04180 [Rickettsiales bacterium]|jgi:hypothetical protein|nr:hypothetical protein [Rickettsiales bacterium]